MAEPTTMFDLDPAARQVKTLVAGVRDDQLSAPTPCPAYTVGDLLDHFMGLTLAFRYAATKSTPPQPSEVAEATVPSRPGTASAAHLDPAWRDRLPVQLDELVAVWRDPSAWQGEAEAGGVTMSAEVMGTVAVNELVLHGWDLARGTGQPFECDPGSADASLRFTSMMSTPGEEAGREGLFGPVVAAPPDAPALERTLGFSGRDPSWTPPRPADGPSRRPFA